MGGGAWPFLVGGAICLVNSDNERDSSLLNRRRISRPARVLKLARDGRAGSGRVGRRGDSAVGAVPVGGPGRVRRVSS